MSTVILLLLTGIGLAGLYFMFASGLSLIFGLMRVLNLAQGAFLTVCAYVGWALAHTGPDGHVTTARLIFALVLSTLCGGTMGFITETVFIRPLYKRETEQLLITVGLDLAIVALVSGLAGSYERVLTLPTWLSDSTTVLGAHVPNDTFLTIATALVIFASLTIGLRRTRYGLIVRAGVENRDMVTALGIDVRIAFTLLFTLGGATAGLAGVLAGIYEGAVTPVLGDSVLIFSFIVIIIGGLGSLLGAGIAALIVAVVQQFANYYLRPGIGDLIAVGLLAVFLLVRPAGILGRERI